MKRHYSGFTVVELIIVIVVIGILAAIVLVSWGNVVTGSRNTSRLQDMKSWMSTFDVYKSRFGAYPVLPTGNTPSGDVAYCLGSFTSTNNKCGQYNSSTATRYLPASASSTLLTNVTKVNSRGKAPENGGATVNSALAGPLVYLSQTTSSGTVTVTAKFIGFFEGTSCPSSELTIISSGTLSSSYAPIAGLLTGLPSGTSASVCYIAKTFSYKP